MRLSRAETLHSLALYSLPPLVAWLGFGVAAAAAASLLMAVFASVIAMNGLLSSADPDLVELHTITYSHYVEKVRWCLDASGVAYREVPSIGILGLVLTGRTVPLLVLPGSRTSIGDSPKILRFLWGAFSSGPGGERLRFLEPTAERIALEKHFDEELGVNSRLWSYWHLLQQRDLTLLMWGHEEPEIPAWQRAVLPPLFPLLVAMLRRMLGVTEARAEAGLAATKKVFAEVDEMLADGRQYLLGDELTFVDITFASLAALVVFPDGYGGPTVRVQKAPLDRMAPAWRAEIEAFRATLAGQFVERLYREERLPR